jgi:hypothetical protein
MDRTKTIGSRSGLGDFSRFCPCLALVRTHRPPTRHGSRRASLDLTHLGFPTTCRSPAVRTALHVPTSPKAPSVAFYVVEYTFLCGFDSFRAHQPSSCVRWFTRRPARHAFWTDGSTHSSFVSTPTPSTATRRGHAVWVFIANRRLIARIRCNAETPLSSKPLLIFPGVLKIPYSSLYA